MKRNQEKNFEDCRNCLYFYGHGYCSSDIDCCTNCPQYKVDGPYCCKCLEKNNEKRCPYFKEYVHKNKSQDVLKKLLEGTDDEQRKAD